jgi:general secretion pathway protein G
VIVVIGILAATVIFALGNTTGESAKAACSSDAKTAEVAVQAYIAAPGNASNTPPSTMSDLYKSSWGETFMTKQTNTAYTVFLGGDTGPTLFSWAGPAAVATGAAGTPTYGVFVEKSGATTAYLYDDPGTVGGVNECSSVS